MAPGGDIGVDMHGVESMQVPFTVVFFRENKSTNMAGVSIMWNLPGVDKVLSVPPNCPTEFCHRC